MNPSHLKTLFKISDHSFIYVFLSLTFIFGFPHRARSEQDDLRPPNRTLQACSEKLNEFTRASFKVNKIYDSVDLSGLEAKEPPELATIHPIEIRHIVFLSEGHFSKMLKEHLFLPQSLIVTNKIPSNFHSQNRKSLSFLSALIINTPDDHIDLTLRTLKTHEIRIPILLIESPVDLRKIRLLMANSESLILNESTTQGMWTLSDKKLR